MTFPEFWILLQMTIMKQLIRISAVGLTLLASCQQNAPDLGYSNALAWEAEEVLEISDTRQPPKPNAPDQSISQKLVKTGGVTFESKAIDEDYRRIKAVLPQFGGYIEREEQHKSNYRVSYEMTIRIPADQFDTVYHTISNFSDLLDNRYSNVEDVTRRYYDLRTRIKNKKALESRYVELLQKASKIQDILEIEDKLNLVRTEVEQLEGQFKYLQQQVSLSTIHVSFYQRIPKEYRAARKEGFGSRLLTGFNDGWQGFLTFAIGVVTLWPFLLLLTTGIWAIRKWRKTRKKSKIDLEP